MKKSLKITGLVLGLGVVFGVGSIAGASNLSWKDNTINDAYSGFLDVASSKVSDLTGNVDADINKAVQNQISGTVEQQEKELQKLLEEYYQMKLNNMTETQAFKELEAQIIEIRKSVAEAYKKQIDDAFKGK